MALSRNLIALCSLVILGAGCTKTNIENTTPSASFEISPESGTLDTQFSFDASGCSDDETNTSQLEVRWDWTNDGNWDTDFSKDKTATFQYSTAGDYTVKLEVKDEGALTDSEVHSITVTTGGVGGDGTLDYEGKTYAFKTIGTQTWLIENLAYLPSVSPSTLNSATDKLYYVSGYEDSNVSAAMATDNYKEYGVLYNWEAAKTACPGGWHLPTDDEWKALEKHLGMSESDADKVDFRYSGTVGLQLKSLTGWYEDRNGDNSSGFNAIGGGRRHSNGGFSYLGADALFWTSTETEENSAWYRKLYYLHGGVYRGYWDQGGGFSVRCLKN